MNNDFDLLVHNSVELLVYRPWWEHGIVHGMTTSAIAFRPEDLHSSARVLCNAIGASDLVLPEQCHGAEFIDLRGARIVDNLITERHGDLIKFHRGDAVLAPTRQGTLKRSLVFGVMTADCVPIIVRAEHGWGLIHAGWRGLANGIIESVVGALGEPLEAVVGPSAGPKAYEVGMEVVEAIGASAVFDKLPGHSHKALLDTAATAIRQLHNANSSISAHNASICTISDPRFHSFRRDGASAGRGITFVLPGS